MSDNINSDNDEGASIPGVAKQALAQKRDVRELNTRLEMLVRTYQDNAKVNNSLKQHMLKQEVECRKKLKSMELKYNDLAEKLRKENENLMYQNKCTEQELNNLSNSHKEFEERLIASSSSNAALSSENEAYKIEINRLKDELDLLRNKYSSIKYKYDSYESEKKSYIDKINGYKSKNEKYLRELTQKEMNLKSSLESHERIIFEKNDEITKLREELTNLSLKYNSTQTRLRKEFDTKLADFVQKREEQYKQEKDEWMRIFKEEFNRKLRSFKEANYDLSNTNQKQENEIRELRTKISKLKQIKVELELQNRSNEEELDKLSGDLDDLRHLKDNEIKHRNATIVELRDKYKAKELQFDELAGIKLQLDSEIELYRNILNDAENMFGYESPFKTSSSSNKNSRKRKRINTMTPMMNMTPMGPPNNNNSNNNNNDKENDINMSNKIITPGIKRGQENAKNDLMDIDINNNNNNNDNDDDDENDKKDMESEQEDNDNNGITPGGIIEGSDIQFSGLDLMKGMIEIQNTSNHLINLSGYILSNDSGSFKYKLPNTINLKNRERVRIYIGEDLKKKFNTDSIEHKEVINDYKGQYIFWPQDVWNGNNIDCARLFNKNHIEISKIEISPDMVDNVNKNGKSNCLLM